MRSPGDIRVRPPPGDIRENTEYTVLRDDAMKSNLPVMGLGSGSAVPTSRDTVFVLLLKRGFLYVEECEKGREFEAADKAGAGFSECSNL